MFFNFNFHGVGWRLENIVFQNIKLAIIYWHVNNLHWINSITLHNHLSTGIWSTELITSTHQTTEAVTSSQSLVFSSFSSSSPTTEQEMTLSSEETAASWWLTSYKGATWAQFRAAVGVHWASHIPYCQSYHREDARRWLSTNRSPTQTDSYASQAYSGRLSFSCWCCRHCSWRSVVPQPCLCLQPAPRGDSYTHQHSRGLLLRPTYLCK